jgi:hypothetical protein
VCVCVWGAGGAGGGGGRCVGRVSGGTKCSLRGLRPLQRDDGAVRHAPAGPSPGNHANAHLHTLHGTPPGGGGTTGATGLGRCRGRAVAIHLNLVVQPKLQGKAGQATHTRTQWGSQGQPPTA